MKYFTTPVFVVLLIGCGTSSITTVTDFDDRESINQRADDQAIVTLTSGEQFEVRAVRITADFITAIDPNDQVREWSVEETSSVVYHEEPNVLSGALKGLGAGILVGLGGLASYGSGGDFGVYTKVGIPFGVAGAAIGSVSVLAQGGTTKTYILDPQPVN